jgi:hypothetical protein
MNASHMDAPTVPMTGLAPQRIACCGVLRFAARSLPQIFTNTEGTWSLPGDSRGLPSRAAWFQIPPYQTHSSRGRFWRLINADGTAVSCCRGVCPQKLSHFALHIQICTMPTEPRGMVQDSYTRHTCTERTLLAPKNADVRSVSVLVSVGAPPPRLSILAASYLGCTSCRAARHFEMRLV